MSKVLQAKLKAQEASNGQLQFSTLQMGMPVGEPQSSNLYKSA